MPRPRSLLALALLVAACSSSTAGGQGGGGAGGSTATSQSCVAAGGTCGMLMPDFCADGILTELQPAGSVTYNCDENGMPTDLSCCLPQH